MSMLGVLLFWRLFMGVGVGADYPLSAVICSEYYIPPLALMTVLTRWRQAYPHSYPGSQYGGRLPLPAPRAGSGSCRRPHRCGWLPAQPAG